VDGGLVGFYVVFGLVCDRGAVSDRCVVGLGNWNLYGGDDRVDRGVGVSFIGSVSEVSTETMRLDDGGVVGWDAGNVGGRSDVRGRHSGKDSGEDSEDLHVDFRLGLCVRHGYRSAVL